jgi:alkyl hydroperoxide reductase subunit AhpC
MIENYLSLIDNKKYIHIVVYSQCPIGSNKVNVLKLIKASLVKSIFFSIIPHKKPKNKKF